VATTEQPRLRQDPAWIAQLRSAFWAAGYHTPKVAEAMGADAEHLQPDPAQALLVRRDLPTGTPLATLIQLFILGQAAGEAETARALAPLTLDHAQELGVVREAAAGLEGAVRITPYGEFLFACSRVPELNAVERDHVMGVTRSSINLANLTIRRPIELALDMGTGSGFQALFTARHASKVIAVDINPVALQFTGFNARLNGIDNIETREGSYLEPVRGMTFDLVVSNPPFVISPDSSFLYRDSSQPGDELSRQLVHAVPEVLNEGGIATLLVSWGRRPGDDWDAVPSGWVKDTGCDAWLFHQASQTTVAHAASWHQPLAQRDLTAYDEAVGRWTSYVRELGYEAIAYGGVLLRRRPGPNWVRSEELPDRDAGPASDQLQRMLAAQDLLAGLPDRKALLEERLALVPNHHLDQTLRVQDGTYAIERALLQLDDGLAFRASVDAFNAYLLTRLDGSRSLRQAIADTLAAVGQGEVDPEEVETAALRSTRRMLELGFLARGPSA
jgi:methylase of polypeptide subunit release factors